MFFFGDAFEDVDEFVADDLAFLLRVDDVLQCLVVFVAGVDEPDVEAHLFHHFDDEFGFVFAHVAGVDVDGDEVFSDGFVDEGCADGAVDAAGEGDEGFAMDLGFKVRNCLGDEFVGVEHQAPLLEAMISSFIFLR